MKDFHESPEISDQQVRAYVVLRGAEKWRTAREIAAEAKISRGGAQVICAYFLLPEKVP